LPNNYVPYSPDVEVEADNEAALIEEIVEQMAKTNREAFERHRHAIRAAHAKSHGFLKGEMVVPDGLSEHLRQGIFARAATYPVIVRLSSGPGDIHSDTVPAPRGMAIKIIGVEGQRLLSGDQGNNQDFLLINNPVLSFGTVAKYKKFIGLLETNTQSPLQGLAQDNHHLLGETYHSMAAIRLGDYIAKISAAPASDNVKALTGQAVGKVGDSTMRDLVVEHFRTQGAEYQLRAQLCADLGRMPVEDASILWPEDLSPHQPIATLRIPSQDAYSPARRVYGDDVLSFNPWHGIREHQPLGSIMRIRIQAYERSSRYRHEMNAQPRVEPKTIDEIPD
jgi:Catalase